MLPPRLVCQCFHGRKRGTVSPLRAKIALAILCFGCPGYVAAQRARSFSGVVRDSADSPIANAVVEFDSPKRRLRTTTDETGTFTIANSGVEGTLIVSSAGF